MNNNPKIDAFCHIIPPKYKLWFTKIVRQHDLEKITAATPTLTDMQQRFRVMDKFPGLRQILTISAPALEEVSDPTEAILLTRIANDEMAELIEKYPDRFVGGVASVAMNDIDDTLIEIDRAINELKLKGIQIFTPMNGEPIDQEKFIPVFEKMASYNLPIWIHPRRNRVCPDYVGEEKSKYSIYSILGWPYETSAAMIRLVMSGVLERLPALKIITHHCGAMIPYFASRIALSYSYTGELSIEKLIQRGTISRNPMEYLKLFYADTALHGNTSALNCGIAFFGVDHIIFATDMPYDPEGGVRTIRDTIKAVEEINITLADKQKILSNNILNLINLR